MREFKRTFLAAAVLVLAASVLPAAFGQYWFQSGVRGGSSAAYNNGASVYIQTVEPQNVGIGAFGFWVGETLQNGAFLQVGYEVPNSSGYYPRECSAGGCNGTVYLAAGYPTWFWEYFPAGYSGSNFYGGIGSNDSVGANGTVNHYWFTGNGNVWTFYVNNESVGSVDLGASSSGDHSPVAYAELAGAIGNTQVMAPVVFKNLSYYKYGSFNLLPEGYSYIGYGIGSETVLGNPYGVVGLGGMADLFKIGSGVPIPSNGTSVWSSAYRLSIKSQFGNATGSGYYSTFSQVSFGVQPYVYINSTTREAFAGWTGTGSGSYTGLSALASASVIGNITETASWERQYYVNVSSQYASASGSGWHAANSTAAVYLSSNVVGTAPGTRELFSGWSNGGSSPELYLKVSGPVSISASWRRQYLVNLTTGMGEARGAGWYNEGSIAPISLSPEYFNATNTSRIAFYSWSGLYNQSSVNVTVNSPLALKAIFKVQHLVRFVAKDAGFNNINVSYFVVGGKEVNGSAMLFDGVPYLVSGAYYKGVLLPASLEVNVSSADTIPVSLPVYNVGITAASLLNNPLNASVYLSFRNGTTSSLYLGSSGSAVLHDVPLGYVSGYAEYGVMQERLSAGNGSNVALRFITPVVLLPVVMIVIVMLIYELIHRRIFGAKR